MSDTPGTVASAEREWQLRDQRDFLQRSLDDAEREHDAGDLIDDDYRLLRRRDEQRLCEVEAALAALESAARAATESAAGAATDATPQPSPDDPARPARVGAVAGPGGAAPPARRRRRRRRWLAAGGAACVAAGVVVLVVELTSPRLPGEAATGSIDLNTAQKVERQLAQAQALVDAHQPGQALQLYGTVLAEDPKDPVALSEWGWLDWEAATASKQATVAAEGASAVVEAVRLDGRLFAAQYYLGTILTQEGDPAKAIGHYAAFLADHPTAKWLDSAAPAIREAYAAAGKPPPAGLPASSTSTSTTAG